MVPPIADAISVLPSPLKSPAHVYPDEPQWLGTAHACSARPVPVERSTHTPGPPGVAKSILPSPLKSPTREVGPGPESAGNCCWLNPAPPPCHPKACAGKALTPSLPISMTAFNLERHVSVPGQ